MSKTTAPAQPPVTGAAAPETPAAAPAAQAPAPAAYKPPLRVRQFFPLVQVVVTTPGQKGSTQAYPAVEVPLLRAKLRIIIGDTATVNGSWPRRGANEENLTPEERAALPETPRVVLLDQRQLRQYLELLIRRYSFRHGEAEPFRLIPKYFGASPLNALARAVIATYGKYRLIGGGPEVFTEAHTRAGALLDAFPGVPLTVEQAEALASHVKALDGSDNVSDFIDVTEPDPVAHPTE